MGGLSFYLGTHRPGWLATAGVPLFVSRRTLGPVKALPRAVAPNPGGYGCAHKSCANCQTFALGWREDLLDRLRVLDNANASN